MDPVESSRVELLAQKDQPHQENNGPITAVRKPFGPVFFRLFHARGFRPRMPSINVDPSVRYVAPPSEHNRNPCSRVGWMRNCISRTRRVIRFCWQIEMFVSTICVDYPYCFINDRICGGARDVTQQEA